MSVDYISKSFTKDGVTMNVTGQICDTSDKNFSGGTFTSTVGNFTKIEVTAMGLMNMGSGWSVSGSKAAWTGTASSTVSFGGSDLMDGIWGMGNGVTIVFTIEEPDAATKFDLTLADGSDAHGTVVFTVDGAAATQAKKDDVVTVSVTPNEGFSTKDVTVRAYTTWAAYTKNLQDAWIQAIGDQTYTGEAIEPTVTVKDGETTLAAGKCWIELVPASTANAQRLTIVHEGETTGINAVSSAAANEDGEWYDLSGRRVAQPTKGIYVKNGKKVIVK